MGKKKEWMSAFDDVIRGCGDGCGCSFLVSEEDHAEAPRGHLRLVSRILPPPLQSRRQLRKASEQNIWRLFTCTVVV